MIYPKIEHIFNLNNIHEIQFTLTKVTETLTASSAERLFRRPVIAPVNLLVYGRPSLTVKLRTGAGIPKRYVKLDPHKTGIFITSRKNSSDMHYGS